MKVSRGLLRLWLAGTALWWAFLLFLYSYDRSAEFANYFPLFISPPGAILAIGGLLYWVLKGFLPDK